ncbi:hypothetical protein M2299_000599 [Stenotrophomonas sp. 1278]|uniref:hypothetical protein n=1 Tax=Stenotrophomonas sp. 1278 TaxID=2940566 RepID=UPI002473569F|nr:hypothetical protein [Stenotrophomonas sp. 1278]MDH6329799.1 hypothetical protein [Stenotrophomonas sp. 1278]
MPQKFIDQTTIQPDGKPGDDAFTAFAICNDNFQDAEARLVALEAGGGETGDRLDNEISARTAADAALGARIDAANDRITAVDATAATAQATAEGKVSKAGDTISGDLYVKSALVTGTPGNAQLTVASDLTTTYIESIRRDVSPGQRRNLNLYGQDMGFTGNTINFQPNTNTNRTRFITDGANMQLQAINASANAFSPMLIKGNEVQLHHSDGIGLKVMPGVVEGQDFHQFRQYRSNMNPGNGSYSFSFMSSGNFGGGYAIQDGNTSGGMWMAGGALQWGAANGLGSIEGKMTLGQDGVLSARGFNNTSSADVKDYIEGHVGDADILLDRLVVIDYRYRPEYSKDDKRYVGLLAENVRDVLSSAVGGGYTYETKTPVVDEDGEVSSYLTEECAVPLNIDPMQILAISVRSHQQKNRRIKQLEEQMVALLARLAALEAGA